ncbi:MAG: STAS domain-containing protein [Planctomycetes bacterium]|nr:STAS domain-containing protein [Planctomycetota bacterium]
MDPTELRAVVELAIERLDEGAAVGDVLEGLTAAGIPEDAVGDLVRACASAFELAESDEDLEPEQLVAALTEGGTSPELAELICDALFLGDDDDDDDDGGWGMDLDVVEGIHVLRLTGDVSELDPEGRAAIREKILEPVFAEDCRLLIDLRETSFFQADVVGLLISDVLAMRDAGGDLSVLVGDDHAELVENYRLGDVVRVEHEDAAMRRLSELTEAPLGAERLACARSVEGGVGVLAPRGAIDTRTLEGFERELRAQLAETPQVVLDFSEVTWVSSAGFGLLVRHASGSALKVAGLRGPAALVAEVLGLQPILGLQPTRAAALAAFA